MPLKFKNTSQDNDNRPFPKDSRDQQLQKDIHLLNVNMELNKDIKSDEKCHAEKSTDVKQNELLLKNSQMNGHSSTNSYSLHDPYDINHIHGLRK